MKNRLHIRYLVMVTLITLSFFSTAYASEIPTENNENPNKTLQLTMEEKIADFEYMYDIFKYNFPLFAVKKRAYHIDWLGKKDEYKNRIRNTKNDAEFQQTMSGILVELENKHTCILGPESYTQNCVIFNRLGDYAQPWLNVLHKPEVISRYKVWSDKTINKISGDNGSIVMNKSCFKTDILEQNKIAYIRFFTFNSLNNNYENDRIPIAAFLKQIKNYSVLIIDVRGNGGGALQYWQQNIVAPLISTELRAEYYGFLRGGRYLEPFIDAGEVKLHNIDELSQSTLEYFPPEVTSDFKYFCKNVISVLPQNVIGFTGKIYLLVDRQSYSAADTFASFAKSTKFATVVGERTGGDGIGAPIDMPIIALPNSGYIVRFPVGLGLNPDGSANEEKCTQPDIIIPSHIGDTYENDIAIQELLKIIKAQHF